MRLETERLLLRPWEARDRAALAAILGDAEVRRFYPRTLTAEQTSAAIDSAIAAAARDGFGFQAAELKATGELAGLIGLAVIPEATRNAIRGAPRVEIGWQFARHLWGQGLAPEGARTLVAHGFAALDLSEIVAFTFRDNLPSQRVMQKLGMSRDPADDFLHPGLAADHPLRPHVVYRVAR